MSASKLKPFPAGSVRLLPSEFKRRFELVRTFMMSLANDNLLQNHYLEAGLRPITFERGHKREGETGLPVNRQPFDACHWGWESPTCQLRGHFLGHWLSAAARIYAQNDDVEIKAKADVIVGELALCQAANGGEWAGSIPEKFLQWAAEGRPIWAPHYTLHKTLMGLFDMYAHAGNEQALDIIEKWAPWFTRWTAQFDRATWDQMLDVESGGMLEIWADMYGATGKEQYRDLMTRYEHRHLFEPLRAGEDVLSVKHANTTIPEIQGAARAWEVTWGKKWRETVFAYWQSAVTARGYFATGGQTLGEKWTPPHELAHWLGATNQEHCTVYNMMRLANYLLRWTGDMAYANYWEQNLLNGILAQQHPLTGMVAYYLPLAAGHHKRWGTPTESFWCCHGTLLQAHTQYADNIFFRQDDGVLLSQFVPAIAVWEHNETPIKMELTIDPQITGTHRPESLTLDLRVDTAEPVEFTLRVRRPWWVTGAPQITVDGEDVPAGGTYPGACEVWGEWHHNHMRVVLPKSLLVNLLPDQPDTVAFMDGPVVLAGLTDEGRRLYGDISDPLSMLAPDQERHGPHWTGAWRTVGQDREMRLMPLNEVVDQRYAVYFPIKKK